MSLQASLHIDDAVYNILFFDVRAAQSTNETGVPTGRFTGGYYNIVIQTPKENILYDWMLAPEGLKNVRIVIPPRTGMGSSIVIDLKDTYCIHYHQAFSSSGAYNGMTTHITLSPGGMYQNQQEVFTKHWHIPSPMATQAAAPDTTIAEKKVTIFVTGAKAENGSVIPFDAFNAELEAQCATPSIFNNYKQAYKPIQVYGQAYYPSWVCMRQGQTITLKLHQDLKKNYSQFTNITIEPHAHFKVHPANLKNAKEVHIQCIQHHADPVQLQLKGDGELVGAINIFYPPVKNIKLEWRFVEFNRYKSKFKDLADLRLKINIATLYNLIQKAFTPLNINITLVNNDAIIADATALKKDFFREKILLEGVHNGTNDNVTDPKKYIYINKTKETLFIQRIQALSPPAATALTLYAVNMPCLTKAAADKREAGGRYEAVGGFSNIGTGIAYIALDEANEIKEENMIHELYHALWLEHIFENGMLPYYFKVGSTQNYMDYNNTKTSLFAEQWQIMHDWLLEHPIYNNA
jgi:hypothetical protein